MTPHHEEVLAEIEQQVRTDGARLDEVDCRIADELGVPHDYYFAYLLVWGAIEAYREARILSDPGIVTTIPRSTEGALARCESLTDSIGHLASSTYQHASSLGSVGREIAGHAAKTLAAVLQLRQNLRDVDTAAPDARGNGSGTAVQS